MANPIRLLIVEDLHSDAELMVYELRRVGMNPQWKCVDCEADYLRALDELPDLILSVVV